MATILTRAETKQVARARFRENRRDVLALNSVAIILNFLGSWSLNMGTYQRIYQLSGNKTSWIFESSNIFNIGFNLHLARNVNISFSYASLIGNLFSTLITAGITIVCLRWLRQPKDTPLTNPFKQQFIVFTAALFVPSFILYFLSQFASLIGLVLLIIPGIMLTLAFQPIYLLYSDIGADDGYFTFLKTCWTFMKGHKWDWFVFELSFLLWDLGVALTGGLLTIYLVPYHNLAMSGFYESIRLQNNELATNAN
ncbi:DUF975 family protein [Lapidilactobacillus salsurivasis]